MQNSEIMLLMIPGVVGILSALHLLYFVIVVKRNSSDQAQVNAILSRLFRRQPTSVIRRELKAVCNKERLIDWYLYGRWFWLVPGLGAVIALIILD